MLYRLAAAAALVAVGVAPAFAQNSSNITGTDRPVSQRGMQPDVGVPGVDGAPATITGDAGPTSSSDRSGASNRGSGASASAWSGTSASGSSAMSTSGGASSSSASSMGASSPGAYPVCRTRSQDSCRVANSRR